MIIDKNDVHIVTVSTDKRFYYPYLVESCYRNGKQLTTLGMGKKWQGYNWKFKLIHNYLDNLPDDDIICFVDGYDVICVRNLNELKNEFLRLKNKNNCRIIVSGNFMKYNLYNILEYFFFGLCKNKNISSGTYIGYVKDIKEIIREIYNLDPKNDSDDQYLMVKYCKKNPDFFYVDSEQELFLEFKKSFHFTDISNEIKIINDELYYNKSKPFFLHGAGYSSLNKTLKILRYDVDENIENELKKNLFYKIKYYFFKTIEMYFIYFVLLTTVFFFIFYFVFYKKINLFKSIRSLHP